jgi:hypothetical protein
MPSLKRTVIFCVADYVPTRVLGMTQLPQEINNMLGRMKSREILNRFWGSWQIS